MLTCHIVIYQESNAYYLTGLEEFCDEELTINQNNGFYISDTIYSDYLNNPLPSPIIPGDMQFIIIVETVIHINMKNIMRKLFLFSFRHFLLKIYFLKKHAIEQLVLELSGNA